MLRSRGEGWNCAHVKNGCTSGENEPKKKRGDWDIDGEREGLRSSPSLPPRLDTKKKKGELEMRHSAE